MRAAATRQQIVAAADQLFYERGYEPTAFADIAAAVGISRGNFYYLFRAKDEILAAVIALRLDRTRSMLERWQGEVETPRARIGCFIGMLTANRTKIMRHGCPVGTLCNELAKLDHHAQQYAAEIFTLFRDWLASQFVALGCAAEADRLAMHVLMRSQGVATLAAAFHDEAFIQQEVEDMSAWLEGLKPLENTLSVA
ncbi:transcriptional regulator [Bosea sp. WAO]|uniref:TetR/AcrR family transcriptional regulator n=1 Tax=Bosea sp. WAO TaxID=406341 RepID=UPI00074A3ABF|nr:TetR/AcrR family transcriptional regulator [Bosea sp. WAO]KUL93987.1 transcriptional regulator [Bosea sp. WAO]